MAGFMPGIHVFFVAQDVDGRDISAFTRVHIPSKTGVDALMDALCPAMTIGWVIGKTLQCAGSRRSRRKRKNSSPSRRRRFIISGLMIISPTIAAILGARK